jgi:preprotein translocase subunit SecA
MLSIGGLASKLFGSSNERRIKIFRPRVAAINALEPEIEKLSDADLQARTETLRQQYKDGTSLDDLLVPAFATVREAANARPAPLRRAADRRHGAARRRYRRNENR